ncbi:GNAT family N-acetyltransferase [Thalassobacillus sp. CUG 92003]|uniref:GNAT family N-acetyltransferase n=1 Tax=Thalassobacillus sp. CUG 92003 TaxID=2736641 RepID=UPI0015E674CF|nr:GNAT family N-acetyltransferase [Thalassobacillus sp. CUG 92003]
MIHHLYHRSVSVAEQIYNVQKVSYAQEARWMENHSLPPLSEKTDDIQASDETFWGVYDDDRLVAFIAFESLDEEIQICRLATLPDWMNKGLGRRLLNRVLDLTGIRKFFVMTGNNNQPALGLYESEGFSPVKDVQTEEGITLTVLEYYPA